MGTLEKCEVDRVPFLNFLGAIFHPWPPPIMRSPLWLGYFSNPYGPTMVVLKPATMAILRPWQWPQHPGTPDLPESFAPGIFPGIGACGLLGTLFEMWEDQFFLQENDGIRV